MNKILRDCKRSYINDIESNSILARKKIKKKKLESETARMETIARKSKW